MKNLLEETLDTIKLHDHSVDDIEFIGTSDGALKCSWEEFEEMADKEYDDGYGGQEVLSDLVIVFKDNTWLSRAEYDGSEWWNFNKVPIIRVDPDKLSSLFH